MKAETRKTDYVSPEIEIIEIEVEKGFATSEELQSDGCGFGNNPWKNQNW